MYFISSSELLIACYWLMYLWYKWQRSHCNQTISPICHHKGYTNVNHFKVWIIDCILLVLQVAEEHINLSGILGMWFCKVLVWPTVMAKTGVNQLIYTAHTAFKQGLTLEHNRPLVRYGESSNPKMQSVTGWQMTEPTGWRSATSLCRLIVYTFLKGLHDIGLIAKLTTT